MGSRETNGEQECCTVKRTTQGGEVRIDGEHAKEMTPNTYLLLGRTGDLCSILPILKQESERPRLVVSNQHSDVLEGVSYVEVVKWEAGIHLLREAYDWAKSKFGTVKSLQVIGDKTVLLDVTYRPAGADSAKTTSFVKEMWRCAGALNKWDEVWPLVFDRRIKEREDRLVAQYLPKKPGKPKKLMLVFTESHSSPFPHKKLLVDLVKLQFSKSHNILFDPKAERFFDLLALYEKAHTVICVDSAPLHLARAVPSVPVFALTNDHPSLWFGTPWMPNHAWYCRYSDFPNRAVEMVNAIDQSCWDYDTSPMVKVSVCGEGFSLGPNTLIIREGMTGRDSKTLLADKNRFPYFKDCLRMGMQKASDSQTVCIQIDQTLLDSSGEQSVVKHSPCFAYRMESNGHGTRTFRPVVDLFAAKKSWWKAHMNEIPDYVFGKDHYWRNGLWALFKKHHGRDITGVCSRAAHSS